MKTKNVLTVLVACLGLSALPGTATAAFLTGAIGFGGIFTPTGGTGNDLSDATGIDIGFSQVAAANGDFIPAVGFSATFNQLDFDPASTPITPLWTVDTGAILYSFDLDNVSVDFQDADELNLSGSGTLMATGFDNTFGTWTFSGQEGNIFFTFSSIAAATDVPEPASLLLLGAGLLGFAASRRRRG